MKHLLIKHVLKKMMLSRGLLCHIYFCISVPKMSSPKCDCFLMLSCNILFIILSGINMKHSNCLHPKKKVIKVFKCPN